MCNCDKPTRNDEPRFAHMLREPKLLEGEVVIADEPGRCQPTVFGKVIRIDNHSHHYHLVRDDGRNYVLLVAHGGGEGRVHLGRDSGSVIAATMLTLDSDARYMLMHEVYYLDRDARQAAKNGEGRRWRQAAAEGRIKTRKKRGMNLVDVWIEDAP